MTSLQNMGYGNETLDMYMPSSRTEGVYTTRVSSDVPCALPPPTRYTLHGRIHACTLKNLCAANCEALNVSLHKPGHEHELDMS